MNTASAEAPKPSESLPHCYLPGYAVVASSSSINHRCTLLPQANVRLPFPVSIASLSSSITATYPSASAWSKGPAAPSRLSREVQDLVCNIIEEDVTTSNELARLVHTSIAGYPERDMPTYESNLASSFQRSRPPATAPLLP
ncbi:hypothetical protein ColKHC_06638 [Colletotrichum higginsianum]|nr:hypothetical protein ColKHC_06638 [Colletotrichum higginsianum]